MRPATISPANTGPSSRVTDKTTTVATVSSAENMTGSIEIHLKAGDALLFVDSLCHGSAKRINKGERRIVVYRYGPSWGFFRHPYRPSKKLLDRLSNFQRKIVMPHEKILTPKQ